MNYGGIKLHFDQLVEAKLLNLSLITLKSESMSSSSFAFSSGAYNNLTLQGNTTIVELYLHSDDYARLVLESDLATATTNTFISLASGAIVSVFGVPSNPVISQQVTNFVPDTSPPYVTKFSFSMNTGDIVIDFSEPIQPLTFMFEGLAFQNRINALNSEKYVSLLNYSQNLSCSNNQRTVTANIGSVNLNLLKRVASLCKDSSNTFLSAWSPFVRDTNNNLVSIESFQRIFGMKVTHFSPDVTSPTLISWDLNLNTGEVILHFDEPLLKSLFNFSGIILCNAPSYSDSSVIMRVLYPIVSSYAVTENPIIQLNYEQFNFVKYHLNFGQNSSNTYLILEPFLAVDTSKFENRYLGLDATPLQSRQVSNLTIDSISPDIVSVVLDLTSKRLTLTFTEIIDINSLNIQEFSLQSSSVISSSTEVFQFENLASVISAADTDTLVFRLDDIFTELKSFIFLGRSADTTFTAYTYRFVKDQQGNNVVEIPSNRARKVDGFITDLENPSLISWSIDMGINMLMMTFTEPIDEKSFNLTALTLQSHSVPNRATHSQSLTASSQVIRSGNDLIIMLSVLDSNKIKRKPNLCKESFTCFLYFHRLIGFDLGTITLAGVLVSNEIAPLDVGMPPSIFTRDSVPPRLLEYIVDLNLGKFYLYFSEPVSPRYVDFGQIKLFDENNEFLAFSARTIIDSTAYYAENIELTLTRQDYFLLKKRQVFNSEHHLWMSCHNLSFFDYAGNFLNGEHSGSESNRIVGYDKYSLVSATQYISDTTGPTVVGLASVGYSSLTLYFNDVVFISSILPTRIILSSFEAIKTYPLTDALLTSTETSSFKVEFSLSSIESQLRKNSPLWSNQKNSYIYLLSSALRDTSSNFNRAISPLKAIRKGPAFLYFKLDMKNGVLSFESVYPIAVDLESFSPTGFTLQNTATNQDYIFSNFIDLARPSEYFYDLQMSAADLENIRQLGIATSPNSLKLTLQTSAIIDLDSNALNATETLDCVQLIPDDTPLSLIYYTLDMSKGHLDLFFDKHVVVSTIDMQRLSLTNSRINPTHIINLGNATISDVTKSLTSSKWIRFDLNSGSSHPSVRDLIHLSKGISLSSSTYLIIQDGFAHDTAVPPNYLAEIIQDFAIQPQSIISDRTPPKLVSYSLNMRNRLLTLTFDEAVDPISIKPNFFKLLASPDRPSTNIYWLTKNTVVGNESLMPLATSTISFKLSSVDIDNIMLMSPHLCTSITNTYLSFLTGAVRDIAVSSNSIQRVFDIYAKQVSEYIPDSLGPSIIHYNVSIPAQYISIYFNEMLNCSATDLDKISFQSTNFIGTLTERFSLHSSSSSLVECRSTSPITRFIQIRIGHDDLLAIKSYTYLMKSASTTNLFLQKGAFVDILGNKILPLVDGHTLPVSKYTGDQLSPRLMSFAVTKQLNLILHFDEPMKVSSLDLSQITFHNGRNPSSSYTLTRASRLVSVGFNLREFMIYLHTDFDQIYGSTDIFSTQNTSYLSLTSDCISDTSGNQITEIPPNLAMNMGPSIVAWGLDMNSGLMMLYLSEQVYPKFSPRGMIIQNQESHPTSMITLSTETLFAPIDDPFSPANSSFTVFLDNHDVTSLKTWQFIGDPTSLYLYSSSELTHSVLRNTIVFPLNSTETLVPILVTEFKMDTTGPQILLTQLDLNLGIFIISFDEPVRADSFIVSKLTFRSTTSGTNVPLTQLANELSSNSSILTLNLTVGDLNALKSIYYQASLDEVVYEEFFVVDLFGNVAYAGQKIALAITSILQDIQPPVLTYCSLDLSASIFDIYFDEIIDLNSLVPTDIVLLSNASLSSDSLRLSNFSIIEGDSSFRRNNVSINLALFREESFRLQRHPSIGKSSNHTYLFIPTFRDVAGNINTQNQSIECHLLNDFQAPSLESFNLKKNSGNIEISLYFSEVVDLYTFNCSDFLLLSAPSPSAETYYPSNCTIISPPNARQITYTFTDPNLVQIGNSEETTYMCLTESSLTDTAGNSILTLSHSEAIRVGPQVVSYLLDINRGLLTLIFSNDIDMSAPFNTTAVGFYSHITEDSVQFSYSDVVTPYFSNTDFVVNLWIASYDLIRLKNIRVVVSELYLLIGYNCFFDSDGVSSPSFGKSKRMTPLRFTNDAIPPTVINITLDFSTNMILFTVDEPIEITSFQPSLVVVQSAAGSLSISTLHYYRLTGGIFTQNLNETFVSLNLFLTDTDMTALKLDDSLATNISTSFISIGSGGLIDFSQNSVDILPENARQVTNYIPDISSPLLLSFGLDMNTGVILLHFSEPINYIHVHPSSIILQSRFSQGNSASFQLSNLSYVVPRNGITIEIQLSEEDIRGIKETDNLARKVSSTFLRADSSMAADLAGNQMIPILDGFALSVSTFAADITRPIVQKISLDLVSNILSITFSEIVIIRSFDPSGIIIQDNQTNAKYFYRLTSSSYVDSLRPYSAVAKILLSAFDLNGIKSLYPLASSLETTFLSLESSVCTDVYGNDVVSIPFISSLQASSYQPDIIPPQLISYILDMDAEEILLQFSEVIRPNSVHLESSFIQQTETKRYGNFVNLSNCEVSVDGSLLIVYFDSNTINQMKWFEVGASAGQSFFSWGSNFVGDVFYNNIAPMWDGSVLGKIFYLSLLMLN